MLKAVIFDMDGVIIDSEPQHARAAMIALSKYGAKATIDYCYNFIGSTTKHMFETAKKDFNLAIDVNALEEASDKAKLQLIQQEGYIAVPGVKELIIDLYNNGTKLAIASSSTLSEIQAVAKALGITKYFNKLISGATVPNPKPAPDVFLKALQELEVLPNESVVIEDSKNGVLASFAASIPSIGFINKNSGNQNLSKASVLIEDFNHVDYGYIRDTLMRVNGEPLTIAITNRLFIKELSAEDFPKLYNIYQDPQVTKYIVPMNKNLELEAKKHKAYIKNIYEFYGYGLWGVFQKDTNVLIGQFGIQNQKIDHQDEIELSYLLDSNYWKHGYALEALRAILDYSFENLALNRLVAVIDKANAPSIKVAKRLGMTLEKEIEYKNHSCYLYSTNIKLIFSEITKRRAATEQVHEKFAKSPDTSVYSKHFQHTK
jgi:HAD superfamily hydrolase (TIGR01509 family)